MRTRGWKKEIPGRCHNKTWAWAPVAKSSTHKVPDGQLDTLSTGLKQYETLKFPPVREAMPCCPSSGLVSPSWDITQGTRTLPGHLATNQDLERKAGDSETLYPLSYSPAWRPTVMMSRKHLLKKEKQKKDGGRSG